MTSYIRTINATESIMEIRNTGGPLSAWNCIIYSWTVQYRSFLNSESKNSNYRIKNGLYRRLCTRTCSSAEPCEPQMTDVNDGPLDKLENSSTVESVTAKKFQIIFGLRISSPPPPDSMYKILVTRSERPFSQQ